MGVPEIVPRETKHGLVADGDGWFVINAGESRWNDTGYSPPPLPPTDYPDLSLLMPVTA